MDGIFQKESLLDNASNYLLGALAKRDVPPPPNPRPSMKESMSIIFFSTSHHHPLLTQRIPGAGNRFSCQSTQFL